MNTQLNVKDSPMFITSKVGGRIILMQTKTVGTRVYVEPKASYPSFGAY